MLRNYNKCYVERALTYLCMQSMVLPIEPAGGEVRKGSRAERKHTFSACFSSQMRLLLLLPASVTQLTLEVVLKCLQLHSDGNWPTSAQIVVDAQVGVTVSQSTGTQERPLSPRQLMDDAHINFF